MLLHDPIPPAQDPGSPPRRQPEPLLNWWSDADGERRRFCSAWHDFTGQPESGFDWRSDVHPDDLAGLELGFQRAFSARERYQVDYRLRRHDGRYRWLLEQAGPSWAADGRFLGYAGICIDIDERKRAEQSLRESEQRFRRSFENPLAGMIIASPDKVFLEVNDRLCEMVGYSRAELLGRTWAELTHPDDVAGNADVLAEVIAGRRDGYVLEKRYRRKDGRTIHVVISARAVRDEQGRLLYMMTMVQDVTASREMERALQAITEGTSAVTGEGFFRSLAKNLTQVLDVRAALVGQVSETVDGAITTVAIWADGEFVPNACYPLADTHCGQVLRGQAPCCRAGERRRFPAGRMLAGLDLDCVAGAPLFDRDGSIVGLITVLDDKPLEQPEKTEQILRAFATRAGAELERLRADREIGRSRALLQAIVEQLPQTVFLKDARELRYLLFNGAGEALLGYPRSHMIGRTDYDMFDRDRAAVFAAHDRQALDGSRMLEITEEAVHTPRGVRIMHTRKIPLLGENGEAEYLLGISEDITDRKQSERELLAAKAAAERANNAKSRFLAAASHDLRQPLSALTLYLGVLKTRTGPELQPLVGSMRDCVASLGELLTDLLDLSKLDAGVVTPKPSDFRAADILSNVISMHAPQALLKGLRLRCVTTRLIAHTDPVLFRRMLGNLVSNAVRYTEQGGVLVGCRRRRGTVWVEVWDTGIGIPANRRAEIFEEFKQLDSSRNRGSGLGLAIVARTANLLGLQVRVRSWPGRGSMFAIELPVGTVGVKAAPAAVAHRPLSVALVEDNVEVRRALVVALSGAGHHVTAAADGPGLRLQLANRRPDIVVSDYRLAAGETGLDVINSLRGIFGVELPAILVTGDTDPVLIRGMAECGIAVQYKPVDIDTLLSAMARLVDGAAEDDPAVASQAG